MPFGTTSLTASDCNNFYRGYYRDYAAYSTSGTGEDTLSTTTITGGTIGSTGVMVIEAHGTISTVTNSTKTIKLYFGSTVIATVSRTAANAQDWFIRAVVRNRSASVQEISVIYSTTDAATLSFDTTTATEDTSTNLNLKTTGEYVTTGDGTVNQNAFEANVQQIQ